MNIVSNNRSVLVFSLLTIASLGAPAWAEDMPFDVGAIRAVSRAALPLAASSFSTSGTAGLPALQDVANLGMSLLSNGGAMPLPVVSTGSVDINSVDMPFLRSNGGQGAFPISTYGGAGVDAGSGGTGGGGAGMPALPPGFAGVMCHGVFAGAIPPGGNIEDFWRGAYGFAGDAAQQEALMREGEWLRQNGQI
ncbi:MAG: hypothetical protein QG574_4541 [Cyanobacteriota bacterium erpe_2018_sw_21hr_WHONDRS-SW48-000092_B_bin.40]|nr:hypothetical protein [Cyanobacteriota bacterium erpe_2018_sw_21hr_WHONDRS-SW48-000092_B_bin.40]